MFAYPGLANRQVVPKKKNYNLYLSHYALSASQHRNLGVYPNGILWFMVLVGQSQPLQALTKQIDNSQLAVQEFPMVN